MARFTRFSDWFLRQPLMWAGLAYWAFYSIVLERPAVHAALYRYFAGENWQLKCLIAALFFAGTASLGVRFMRLLVQFASLERLGLSAPPIGGQPHSEVHFLLGQLDDSHGMHRDSYLVRRIRSALIYVRQKRSADKLEEELHHLEEADARGMHQAYAGVRVIAAAIPILGLLGTAIGAAVAFFGLPAKELQQNVPVAMAGVATSLEPTVESLGLLLLFLFAKAAVERFELRLLAAVDQCANRQLVGRFRQYGSDNDPNLASSQRIGEKLLNTVQAAVARHDEAMTKSIAQASRRWEDMAMATSATLRTALGETLGEGLKAHAQTLNEGVARHTADLQGTLVRHAEILSENIDQHTAALTDALEHHTAVMTQTEHNLAEENRKHLSDVEAALGESMVLGASRQEKLIQQSEELLKEIQVALVEAAGSAVSHQEQLVKQSDVLLKVVEATGQIRKLEEALNGNLAALSTSRHFEETIVSLAAALQLFSAKLGRPYGWRDEINLGGAEPASHAA